MQNFIDKVKKRYPKAISERISYGPFIPSSCTIWEDATKTASLGVGSSEMEAWQNAAKQIKDNLFIMSSLDARTHIAGEACIFTLHKTSHADNGACLLKKGWWIYNYSEKAWYIVNEIDDNTPFENKIKVYPMEVTSTIQIYGHAKMMVCKIPDLNQGENDERSVAPDAQ